MERRDAWREWAGPGGSGRDQGPPPEASLKGERIPGTAPPPQGYSSLEQPALDLREFKARLFCKREFRESQGYREKACLEKSKKRKKEKMTGFYSGSSQMLGPAVRQGDPEFKVSLCCETSTKAAWAPRNLP